MKDFHQSKRGIVGIGTLIIFISLIMVSIVAAGVIIRTSGALSEQARETGEEALRQVSTGVQVIGATGRVKSNENVENINIITKLRAGSKQVDLKDMTIGYMSDSTDKYLSLGKYGENDMAFENRAQLESQWSNLDSDEFSVVKVQDISGTNPEILSSSGDVVEIWINTDKIEGDKALQEEDEVTLKLVPEVGFETRVGLRVPISIVGKEVVELN